MNQIDNEFFETYKRLDNICGDMYSNPGEYKAGVKMYLEDMEKNYPHGVRMIPKWEETYRTLKRCKRIRDKLAHSENYSPQGMSSPEDIVFVKLFYQSIMNQTDPLALLNKQTQTVSRSSPHHHSEPHQKNRDFSDEKSSGVTALLIFVCIGLILLLTIALFSALILRNSYWG